MKSLTFTSGSPEETIQFASRWGAQLPSGSIVVLSGDLGSGKTVFVKGVAQGLQVEDVVTSPTFVFINEYKGEIPVYHLDLYRIETVEQAESIGYLDYLNPDGVTLIEWGERIKEALGKKTIWVELQMLGENKRQIHIRWNSR